MVNNFADSTEQCLYVRDEESFKATFYRSKPDVIIIKSVEGCELHKNGAQEIINFLKDHFNL